MKTQLIYTFIATFVAALSGTSVFAQIESEPCGSGILHEQLLESDPHYARTIWNMERHIELAADQLAERDDEIFTIPVVVHVVHEGEPVGQGSNISDEQIFSAIVALNEDFRKIAGSNGDGAGVDCGIEFCLAARDPNGNSSNGINRVNGSGVTNYADMGIASVNGIGASESAVKALSTWPRASYLNIWVVNEIENNDAGNGIQGYAYFPTNSPLDGVVLLHNVFGTVGNLKPSANLNRTASHEVGHYLALYHTFHNTTSCSVEANCNTGGDRVCDTPVTTLNTSCSNPACGGTQQVENYMDYTSETCRDMFTQGQKDRMRATLLNERSSLLLSLGCNPVTALDAAVTAIHSPSGSLCDNQVSPEISLSNFGSSTLSSISIQYGNQGGAVQNHTWTGSLGSGASVTIELPSYTSGTGNQVFYAQISAVNGANDEYDGNDEDTQAFTISSGAGISIVFTLDYFGSETTWELFDEGGLLMASGGPYIDNNQGTQFIENICLSTGCYSLTVYDEYGDGMGFTNGNFQVYDSEGNNLGGAAGNFGDDETVNFCLEAVIPEGEPPVANFGIQDNTVCAGTQIDFSDLSTGEAITNWTWSFPGGTPSSSSQQNPQNITYNTAGTYNVTLTVSNAFGNDSHIITSAITVHPNPSVSINANNVSCNGAGNGSASALATGQGPFSYSWSNGATSSSINSLNPGSYSVTVTSTNGCTATASASITQPSALSLSLSANPPTCFGGNNGSATASVSGGSGGNQFSWSNGGNGATQSGLEAGTYNVTVTNSAGCQSTGTVTVPSVEQIQITTSIESPETCAGADGILSATASGGTAPYTYQWAGEGNAQEISGLSNGAYSVTVSDVNGCSNSASVILPLDCEQSQQGPVLIAQHCSAAGFHIDDFVTVEAPEGAEMYLWRFESASAGILTEEYTMGNNPNFLLDDIVGLVYGISLEVRVKALIQAEWTPYGEPCTIHMANVVPSTGLSAADCGMQDASEGTVLHCEAVGGAEMYAWNFTTEGATITLESYIPMVTIQMNEGFQAGVTYSVSVLVQVGALWSEAGPVCDISFEQVTGVASATEMDPSVNIYPNPGTGENISFEIHNLSTTTHVIDCELYDSNSRLVEKFALYHPGRSSFRTEHQFTTKLSAGMYFLKYDMAGQAYQQKMIVR